MTKCHESIQSSCKLLSFLPPKCTLIVTHNEVELNNFYIISQGTLTEWRGGLYKGGDFKRRPRDVL